MFMPNLTIISVYNLICICCCNQKDCSVLIWLLFTICSYWTSCKHTWSCTKWFIIPVSSVTWFPFESGSSTDFSLFHLSDFVLITVTFGLLIKDLNLHPDLQSLSQEYWEYTLCWTPVHRRTPCMPCTSIYKWGNWVTNTITGMFLGGRTCKTLNRQYSGVQGWTRDPGTVRWADYLLVFITIL